MPRDGVNHSIYRRRDWIRRRAEADIAIPVDDTEEHFLAGLCDLAFTRLLDPPAKALVRFCLEEATAGHPPRFH